MKDPQAIGEFLLAYAKFQREELPGLTLSECADLSKKYGLLDNLPDYPKNFQHDYKSTYLDHLKKQGDKYALEMAKAIEKGEEISEDPSGE